MRKRSKSREKTWPIWREAAKGAGGGERLHRALSIYLAEDPDVKRTGGPGFHLWLADGKWDAVISGDPADDWPGPRSDVVIDLDKLRDELAEAERQRQAKALTA